MPSRSFILRGLAELRGTSLRFLNRNAVIFLYGSHVPTFSIQPLDSPQSISTPIIAFGRVIMGARIRRPRW